MFSCRLVPGLLAVTLDAVHQLGEAWILMHVAPVWIRLKPFVVLIPETNGGLQPSQRFDLTTLQEVTRGKPVGYIVIGLRHLPNFRRQLFICFSVLSLGTQADGKDRPHAVHLRVTLYH